MREYIEPLITCDRILELFTPQNPTGPTHTGILQALGIQHQTDEAAYVLAALSQLEMDKHLQIYGHSNNLYKVTGSTFQFKALGSYKGQVQRENEIEQAKSITEKMAIKSSQSVIDTNASIITLNQNTSTFYEKQKIFNNWQKGLTIAIMISTATYTIISYFMLRNQNKQLEQEKTKSEQQVKDITLQILQDSVFLKNLKKSLK